ncbi:ATPase inhibitor mai-2, mitochondrial-like isoform X2 [Zootermopsis nevadensis]|uniref:ATPase inhibitor mai-2, mitochondrial-like isoform X2 n=1 Tax=Zootermopsis nevadensis TaxID=136037 RepID=UPI000B8EBF5C|nr:ATPase inhibitor mai-2, mitochondrial-like isoform X2 [Zootermopsis nevadensis]
MNSLHNISSRLYPSLSIMSRYYSSQLGDLGSGAGKGGGGGGSIREAGGAFGKIEAGREEEFFYKQQKEQLKKLKEDLKDEISFHEEQVKRHQEAIKRHKERVKDIESKSKH